MYLESFITLLLLISTAPAQDANCDYLQNVLVGVTYNFSSPRYPGSYPAGIQCRWTAICLSGYNCRIYCPNIELPESASCSWDRLLVSRNGDPQLNGADVYCGRGSLTAVSTGQQITMGLITARNTTGGRFFCQLSAQPVIVTPPTSCQCGNRKQNRIVGGEETGVNEFPMMAGLVDVGKRQIKCGAVIISSKYVMTAAHCLTTQQPNNTVVLVGEHDVTTGSDTPATKGYKVNRFITHPQFTDSNYDYDVGLVEVAEPIQFSDRVGVVCLPFKYVIANFTGAKVTVLGWGTLFPGGPTSNVLRKVTLDVISDAQCRTSVPNLTSRQICTYKPGKDSCQDDSGGPVLYSDPITGRLFSVGIVSYGRFCASRSPGINTRVTSLLDWIVNTTGEGYCYMLKFSYVYTCVDSSLQSLLINRKRKYRIC